MPFEAPVFVRPAEEPVSYPYPNPRLFLPDQNINPFAAAPASAELLFAENAVDYAPEGGELVIGLREDMGNRVVISIANFADDLDPSDLPRLFDRFWRKEASRSGGLHSGLGL